MHPWTVIALSLLVVSPGSWPAAPGRRRAPRAVGPRLERGGGVDGASGRATSRPPGPNRCSGRSRRAGRRGPVRGTSMTGMSYLDVVLRPGADGGGRQGVRSGSRGCRASLPSGARYQIGPVASSTGWVFQYALFDPTHAESRRSLRRLQDTVLRPALAALGGWRRWRRSEARPRRSSSTSAASGCGRAGCPWAR